MSQKQVRLMSQKQVNAMSYKAILDDTINIFILCIYNNNMNYSIQLYNINEYTVI